ncbi:MAG: HAMP domain-containing histidine kinase, partial [Pseudobutyrivibrio sp.]|nr:HAMP domain-containing histidine kinase [Pseudobutyrivibrio sp.]
DVQEDEVYYTIEDSEETEASNESEVTTDYLPEETVIENGATGADSNLLYIGGKGYKPLSDSVSGYVLALETDEGATGKLSLDNVADLSGIHSELTKLKHQVSLDNISFFGLYQENPDLTYYTVVCFPNETKLAASTYTNDFYAQAKAVSALAPTLKIVLPLVAILSFAIAIASWIMFMCVAGHRKGVEGIVEGPIEKIPADLALVVAVFAISIVLGVTVSIVDSLDSTAFGLVGMLLAVAGIISVIIGFLWSSNIAVNFKLHHVWKNSLICMILGVIKRWLSVFNQETKYIRSTVKWTYRIWAIFVIITILEWFGIMITSTDDILFLWFVEKVAFGIILHIFLKSYARIKGAALALAEGDTSAQVDLNGMPLFLEEHAKAMNDIQSGISVALDERTKSERMKTELITNVSHDIKTPLTSIINYVDLLEKEEIKNDKAKEYLEVLDRQSKRLKKLIEDLIEASKVSTGNINFNFENVNAVTLLNQSIGEFTDRLEANNITVVTSFPENDLYLKADNRYLWRVFDNLMSNIVKYAQPNTRAYITLEEDGTKLKFTFRNTSKEELNISAEELMERFVRGDKSRYTDGNGLGLSIARSLTEAMGGNMNLSIDGDLFKAILTFDIMKP